jgi:hypothetical protein
MSTENITLLVFAAILCCLNLLFGPLAEGIAKLFARFGRDPRQAVQAEDATRTAAANKGRAEKRTPPGPGGSPPVALPSHGASRSLGEAQMSKYR